MFPTALISQNSIFSNLGFGSDSDPKEYSLGKNLAQTMLWESFWDRLAQNWCPTNINDFKHSINRPLARRCEQDRSRFARVLLAPCSRAARARSPSRPPRVAPALRAPAVRAPAIRAPALCAPKTETQSTTSCSFLGMETPDSAKAQRGRCCELKYS
jgi:hypothetical protein